MNNPLNLSLDYAKCVNKIFLCLGYPTLDIRYVGGCVRDYLINSPINDIDIATPDTPDKVINKLKSKKIKFATFGESHGNIKAIIKDYTFDITSLRKDHFCDGRHALVEYTNSWVDDAKRRDFTFNALSMSPSGDLYDYFKGKEHIKSGHVVFIGNARNRIQEDFLRILRFFRFTSLYGKADIDLSILKLCEDFSWGLNRVSSERITYEITKILGSKNPVNIFNQMKSCKILDVIFDKPLQISGLEKLVELENKYFGPSSHDFHWHLRLASILSYKKIIELKNIILSNTDKIILKNIFDAASMLVEIINSNNLNSSLPNFLYKFGDSSFAINGFLLANSQHANSSGQIWPDLFKEINSYKHSKFPINARVLLSMGFKEGKNLGDELRYLENLWISSGFTLTIKELKDELVKRKKP